MKKSPEKGVSSPYKQLQAPTYQRSQATTGVSSPVASKSLPRPQGTATTADSSQQSRTATLQPPTPTMGKGFSFGSSVGRGSGSSQLVGEHQRQLLKQALQKSKPSTKAALEKFLHFSRQQKSVTTPHSATGSTHPDDTVTVLAVTGQQTESVGRQKSFNSSQGFAKKSEGSVTVSSQQSTNPFKVAAKPVNSRILKPNKVLKNEGAKVKQ